jgi:TldD protein
VGRSINAAGYLTFQFQPGSGSSRSRTACSAGHCANVAYQATTTDFWGSLDGLGGPSTWVLGGAMNCGKAQPGQVAAV